MKRKGLIGLVAVVASLWVVLVAAYGSQVQNESFDGKQGNVIALQTPSSCSSTTSSGGE